MFHSLVQFAFIQQASALCVRWRSLTALCLLLAEFCSGAPTQAQILDDPEAELQARIQKKSSAISIGDTEQIRDSSKKLCALTLRFLAGIDLQKGAYLESEKLYEQSLELEDNLATRAELANTYLRWNKPDKALAITKQLLEGSPTDSVLWRLHGQAQLEQGDFAGASVSLTHALQLRSDLSTMYLLGTALLRSQQEAKAAQLFEQAVQQMGDTAALRIGFAITYQDAGLLKEAIDEYQRALILDPAIPNGHFLLGNAYLAKCAWSYNPDSAREFAAALEQNPSDYKSNLALGLMDSDFALYDQAAKYFRAASAASPDSAAPFLGLGFDAFEQHNYPAAKENLQQALNVSRDRGDLMQLRRAYVVLSKIAAISGDQTTAAAMFKQARNLENQVSSTGEASLPSRKKPVAEASMNPSSSAVTTEHELAQSGNKPISLSHEEQQRLDTREQEYRHLLGSSFNDWGTAEGKSGDYAAALRQFHEAEYWDSGTKGLMENIGLAAYKLGDYAEAARALKLVQAGNQSQGVRAMLASALFLGHNYAEAASVFSQLGDAIFDDPPMTYQWAVALARCQQRERSVQVLSRLQPDNLASDDAVAVGRLYLELTKYDLALKYFRSALQQNAGVSGGHYGAGVALSHLSQNEAAISEFNHELRDNPGTPEASVIHAQLAQLYRMSGRKADADREQKLSKPAQ